MADLTPLRRRMIEDMTIRNLSPATQQSYVHAVAKFSRFFGRSPDPITPAAIDTVRSARDWRVENGWKRDGLSCCRFPTSTLCSPCRRRSPLDGTATEPSRGGRTSIDPRTGSTGDRTDPACKQDQGIVGDARRVWL
jgi:hypothetical protein